MKPLLFLLSIIILNLSVYAQDFYTSDGKKATTPANKKTVGDLLFKYNSTRLEHDYLTDKFNNDHEVEVFFKLFTNEPILIRCKHPENIKKYVSSFNLKNYFNSWQFESDLSYYIKAKTLTDIYVIKTLGQPDKKTKAVDANNTIETFFYNKLTTAITFTNSIATQYAITR